MAKKIEDKIVKNVWSYEEGRAGLKNTKIEKFVEKIVTIIFGRKGKTSFQDIIDLKQKNSVVKTPEKTLL